MEKFVKSYSSRIFPIMGGNKLAIKLIVYI